MDDEKLTERLMVKLIENKWVDKVFEWAEVDDNGNYISQLSVGIGVGLLAGRGVRRMVPVLQKLFRGEELSKKELKALSNGLPYLAWAMGRSWASAGWTTRDLNRTSKHRANRARAKTREKRAADKERADALKAAADKLRRERAFADASGAHPRVAANRAEARAHMDQGPEETEA
jgi:hypothetical protein